MLALLLQEAGELHDCFGCTGHRPGPWLLASVSAILKANTTLGQLLLAPAVQTGRATEEVCILAEEGMGWAAEKQGTSSPPQANTPPSSSAEERTPGPQVLVA